MNFTIQCILMGLCGTIVSTLAVMYSLSKKAKAANLIFNASGYFKTDWFAPVISVIAVAMAAIALPYIPASWENDKGIIITVFATIGYSGNDLVSRFFSVVNQRLNGAIDYKSNKSDASDGIPVGTRTPAAPISKPPEP